VLSDPEAGLFVAERDGEVLGLLHMEAEQATAPHRVRNPSGWVSNLVVRADARADLYGLRFSANFDLLHMRRMLASSDPLYQEAVDVRFLYQLLDLFFGYFHARGLAARGEKDALRYLAAQDGPYLELFRACLGEADRTQRVELYQELVRRTVAPIGPLWPPGSTAATVQDATPERVAEAPRFWDALFDGRDQRPPPAHPALRRGA
jgi:hypothetical protein